ncbi:MAG TPA: tRNA pseudouridine(55) synthase TruB [Patescibacteria group bacterium]|nr:tRNA pseudouridine(55) synthase TruB [Patescibacteria group bacterium]
MDGILLVDKPVGWTSFDVVGKVRGVLRQSSAQKIKVGHTGTLDPLATGLLVLLLGSYTKRAVEFTKLDKTYEVTMELGQTSTTGDNEGTKTRVSTQKPTSQQLAQALEQFNGEIMQTPPAFSAIKVDGQRAYKLARAGKEVKMEPRKATIYRLEMTDYIYPTVKFVAQVSSGTYIRSLVEDIGRKLGTGAYMSGLNRIKVGKFVLLNALDPDQLSAEQIYSRITLVKDE